MELNDLLTFVEYFAGIGLFKMGLESQGWTGLWANDSSSRKAEMYKDFFPEDSEKYKIKDIFNIDVGDIPPASLATAGFPCIDLSLAGNQAGINGLHSSAFWGLVDILGSQGGSAPQIVLIENVPGWLTSNKGEDFKLTVEALNQLGYWTDVFVLDARRFTPQSRLRVFLVGTKHRLSDLGKEAIISRNKALLSTRLRKTVESNEDLMWSYIDIPSPPPLRSRGLSSEIIEEMSDDDGRWWSNNRVEDHLQMMNSRHHLRVEDLRKNEFYSYRTLYRRRREGIQRAEVRSDDIAGCLRTAVGGSSKQFVLQAGKGQVRMRNMTSREYARLQGVPDSYPINVEETQALTGLGDAVSVDVVAWIGGNVIEPIVLESAQRHMEV